MASNGLLDPPLLTQTQTQTQTHSKIQPLLQEQKHYAHLDSEPDTPLPSSLNPASARPSADDIPADKVTQHSPANPIDTTLSHVNNGYASLDVSSKGLEAGAPAASSGSGLAPELEPGSEPRSSSPPALYPTYAANLHELSAASVQYFPTFSASPAKLNHLQNLMSTLHKIMNDQSFAMGDLKTQVDEIQDVLNRVSSKKDNMTTEERQILHNAQMMKDLAVEVVSSSPAIKPWTGIDKQEDMTEDIQSQPSLTLTMPSPHGQTEPTEAPPPSASTPPPGLAFQPGYLRHRSSTASFASSMTSDRAYTQDGDELPSRPSSVASSHRRHRKKSRQSLRQLEPLSSSKRSSQVDHESNAAYDRICSLLTELITDASTAVSTAPDGSQHPNNMGFPVIAPILPSDSESSSESGSEEEGDDSNNAGGENEGVAETKEIEDPFIKRLQGPEVVERTREPEVEVELEPVDRYRTGTGFRSRLEKSTKRQSSLFMELQSTPAVQDATPKDEFGRRRQFSEVSHVDRDIVKERVMRRPRHSVSCVSINTARPSRPSSMYLPSTRSEIGEGHDYCESAPTSPMISRRLGHRDSMSSLRSEPVRRRTMDSETKRVDTEFDRTVETIDGLTRDLVTVATHQNLMQIRLQKTLQVQKEQIQEIERAHSTKEVSTPANSSGTESSMTDPQADEQNPLADLSNSLKQVAASVEKVIASSNRGTRDRITSREQDSAAQSDLQRTGRFSRKDFSRYLQEVEKVAALGSKFGLGRVDESSAEGETLFDAPELQDLGSGSSTVKSSSKNHSCRNSTATLVGDDLGFSLDDPSKSFQFDSEDSGLVQDKIVPRTRSRSSSASIAPPELEDFAAQCRLLTRALVLPFIQLTHHAMTSQDSVFALSPPPPAHDVDSTLEVLEELDSNLEVRSSAPSVSGTRSPSTVTWIRVPRDMEIYLRVR
ncbi:hypothetical protein BGX31_011683 [Mortierella sp. GBA43]|nr:hypothetical protein BGX31_011683 [Mortierella sp. GBA43]